MAPAALFDHHLPAVNEQPPASAFRRDSIIANAMYRRNSAGADERDPTYHNDEKAKYVLPNDFPEHVRLEAQAVHLSAMMHDRVLHAPVTDGAGKRMLDIGCGTGIVTDLMAEKFPNADCFGLDLSRVPDLRPHGKNVRFFQGNATAQTPNEWTLNDGGQNIPEKKEAFDYLFSRLLILGMSNWAEYLKTEFSLLRPGGWVEIHDLDWDWYNRDSEIISKDWNWLRLLT